MKYVLCAVILAAFSATLCAPQIEAWYKRSADWQRCYDDVRHSAYRVPGLLTGALADCDTAYKLGQ